MLKLGEKSIKSLYYGAKAIKKAYLGEKLVFNKKPYYCEIEYLESTGTQYIPTDLYFDGDGYKFEFKYDKKTILTTSAFGYQGSGDNGQQLMIVGHKAANNVDVSGETLFWCGQLQAGGVNRIKNNIIPFGLVEGYVEAKNNTLTYKFNEVSDSYEVVSSFNPKADNPLWIFANPRASTTSSHQEATMKLYFLRVYKNNIIVAYFIPVLDLDMKPCLYDKVSGKLFYNQGSDDFLYGREIHDVEYLESDGNQYIDTNYIIKSLNHKITVKFGKITGGTTAPYWIAGSQGSGNTRSGGIARITNDETKVGVGIGNIKAGSTTYRTDNPNKLTTMSIISKDTMKFDWIVDGEIIYKDISFGVGSVSGYSEHIWGLNFRGANGYIAICPISQYKLEDDGILVRDMIPAIDENGKGFMFDRVSHTIFDNEGSGEFLYGDKI